jgi:cephalosporin hydroxylase
VVGYEPYPLDEIFLMCSSVLTLKPTHIFEWGTHLGRSARIFQEVILNFKIPSEIHSFDLPDDISHVEHPGKKRAIFIQNMDSVSLYQEDGLAKSFEIFNSSNLTEKRAMFYLDGDHSFSTVDNELNTIIKNCENPIFLLHDTFFQSNQAGYNIGPYEALKAFILNNPSYSVINTNFGLPGMSLVFKK